MSSAVRADSGTDLTDLPYVLRQSVTLGVITAVVVVAMSFITRFLAGAAEFGLGAVVLVAGLAAVTFLPGSWTRPRTIEGIAGAAGVGLAASVVFLVIDVSLLQTTGIYTNRWREIGGGSNWWYHPVWWMVGTFLPWMGAQILASQARKGAVSIQKGLVTALALTVACWVVAVLTHFPGAGWNLGSFGVSFLPGVTLAAVLGALGGRRS
ncbi:MAG TPA: hypothetical protein PK948_07190 [Gemmatimonadales bacterium]|jgi:hypothetical protein|nr:hypothetical protein [Gemmatimonadales bacterium]